MIEGSGSGSMPMTNGSGSRRPKNMRVRRIRIFNTGDNCKVLLIPRWCLERYTHKTSGFKTSGFKMSGFKTSETSGLQNVRFTKRQVYKTSGLQNVRLQNVRFQNVLTCKYFKTPVFKEIHWPHLCCGLSLKYAIDPTYKFYTSVAAMLRSGDRGKVMTDWVFADFQAFLFFEDFLPFSLKLSF
jgi:hypothetical protein